MCHSRYEGARHWIAAGGLLIVRVKPWKTITHSAIPMTNARDKNQKPRYILLGVVLPYMVFSGLQQCLFVLFVILRASSLTYSASSSLSKGPCLRIFGCNGLGDWFRGIGYEHGV